MNKEQHWSQFADGFEENNNYVIGLSDVDIMLTEVFKQIKLNKTLELACGAGTYSKILAKNANKLIATDFSGEMLSYAKHNLKDLENVIIEKADCFNLNYDSESFDTVFMANLLHVIDKPEKAIEKSANVLKKKGRIIILDVGSEGMSFFNKLKLFYRYKKTYGKQPKNRQNLTVNKIKKIVSEKGFKIQEAKLIGKKTKAAFIVAIKK